MYVLLRTSTYLDIIERAIEKRGKYRKNDEYYSVTFILGRSKTIPNFSFYFRDSKMMNLNVTFDYAR